MFMHHEFHHQGSGRCCCQPGRSQKGLFQRRFSTRQERIAQLEEYLKDLQAEATAVEEHLDRIKSGK